MLHSGPPHDSNFGYAHAKRMIDVSNRAYKAQYGCNFTAVIPTNVYGLHDNFREGCHFIPGIIKRVHDAKVRGESTIHVPGTGAALRQFIYSRDLAALIVRTLREYNSCEPLILSVGEEHETSISDTVKLVCALSGFKGEIMWDDSKADGQLKKTADNSKMRSLMGDFEFTPLEQGLRETIQWYDANADNAQAKEQIIL
ncbi:hypothetical protein HO173_011370 [Letharia columbiana]|uniref:NAD-dependent epimerase/dehydratase domain-containing protein n=1 Tax=Letharia columbiana TaxID=112416 RepID=A0A8H6KZA8_9LECA|nr:uncharacterized protein HO173_011370 [Letharia columbiana]KAF6229723.1 hypothetical protein HO173_011370 [Letharia columbiana]